MVKSEKAGMHIITCLGLDVRVSIPYPCNTAGQSGSTMHDDAGCLGEYNVLKVGSLSREIAKNQVFE